MRPLELTLEGFRSYRDRAVFDFRDRRLVGVVGPIGAGKSSILDAIAFALYAKTPTFERDTRSLIHQLSDVAHVELVFEVEGQVWRAQRGLRRRGASGHKLEHLGADAPDAAVIETVVQERATRERVETLLGMSFDAFRRSVLLAQNRFSEFLKATPGERNDVLKGVFGYERFDAAREVARSRAAAAEGELAGLAAEGESLRRAAEELAAAREDAEALIARDEELAAARPSLEGLAETRAEAARAADVAQTRIGELEAVATELPSSRALEDATRGAADLGDAVRDAEADVDAAEQARARAIAERDALAERLGDADELRSFAGLVERHEAEARASAAAAVVVDRATEALSDAQAIEEQAAAGAALATDRAAAAEEALAAATGARIAAEEALHAARHADMARALRSELVTGEPCPVCAQVVTRVPPAGRAPAVVRAERAQETARGAEAEAERARAEARAAAAAAHERSLAATEAVARASASREEAQARHREAEAALAVTSSTIVDRLGDGDPRALLVERERELGEADAAVSHASAVLEGARATLEALRRRAAETADALAELAATLTGCWGRLGERRTVERTAGSVRAGFVELGETIAARLQEAGEARAAADADAAAAAEELREALAGLGLAPDADPAAALAEAHARRAAAEERVRTIGSRLEEAADLEDRVAAAERRRDLAKRLASDLQPARFLAYLLEEERAALAGLGSVHFEELTAGSYRFSDDDTFRIVDLNAGATERSPDSLSGGETFLASLALALALAEMVARGGGRLDAFFLDEGFGSLDPEHLDRAMDGIGRLVAGDGRRLVVLVSHVAEMREAMEDLIVLDKDARTGDTVVVSGARPLG
jgi:exonuclease SbcC